MHQRMTVAFRAGNGAERRRAPRRPLLVVLALLLAPLPVTPGCSEEAPKPQPAQGATAVDAGPTGGAADASRTGAPSARLVLYEVVFRSTWDPADAPAQAHFSPLVAASHTPGAPFWDVGAASQSGVAALATTGEAAALEASLRANRTTGGVCQVAVGPPVPMSAGVARLTIGATEGCSSVSVMSAIGPSPDWFVGLSDQPLRQGDAWIEESVVPARVFDAGVDDGAAFTAADRATQPRAPITECANPAFRSGDTPAPIGTFTLTRIRSRCEDVRDVAPDAAGRIGSVHAIPTAGNTLRQTIAFETADRATAYVLFWAAGDVTARVSRPSRSQGTHAITLVGLREETQYSYRVVAVPDDDAVPTPVAGDQGSFTTGPVPEDVARFSAEVRRESADPSVAHAGRVLVNRVPVAVEERQVTDFVILDEEARIVWYERVPLAPPYLPAPYRWTADGTLLTVRDEGGVREIRPDGEVLRSLDVTADTPLHHEIFLDHRGRVVVLGTVPQKVGSGAAARTYQGDSILVLGDDGQPLWRWTTFDVLSPEDEPYTQPLTADTTSWLNANALAVDADGNYLVSLRLANQILKVDAHTGALLWRLGGTASQFALAPSDVFFHQHSVTAIGEDRLLMFDNGGMERPSSRVLELAVDPVGLTAQRTWEYALPPALTSAVTSSVVRQPNGNTLVLSGLHCAVLDVTRQGEVVWQVRSPGGLCYRAAPVALDACPPVPIPTPES